MWNIVKINKKIIFYATTFVFAVFFSCLMCEVLFYAWRSVKLLGQPRDTITFYVVGGSTSYGEPFYNDPSFAKLVKDALGGKYQGLDIEIEMIASPGKTLSSNIYDLVKAFFLDPRHRAIILAYTGINDRNPCEYEREFYGENFVGRSVFGLFIYNLARNFFLQERSMNKSLFLYESRLQRLVSWANRFDYQVYLSELVGNFHDYPPEPDFTITASIFRNLVGCYMKKDQRLRVACVNDISREIKQESAYIDFIVAREEYRQDPSSVNLQKLDQCYQTRHSRRPLPCMSEVIRKVAQKNVNTELVPLIDKFKGEDDGFIGYNLFVDVFHPNLRGMILVSRQFLNVLTKEKMTSSSVEEVRAMYKLELKYGDIARSSLESHFYDIFLPGYEAPALGFYHNFDFLLKNLHDYFPEEANVMKYLIYPILPVGPPVKLKGGLVQYLKDSELDALRERLFKNFHYNGIANEYRAALELAREASVLSEEQFREYLSSLSAASIGRGE